MIPTVSGGAPLTFFPPLPYGLRKNATSHLREGIYNEGYNEENRRNEELTMLTGLLYAMRGEIKSLLTPEAQPERVAAGVAFYRIRENGRPAAAAWGKVNAAMATQLFIDLYRPDRLINVGWRAALRSAHRDAGAGGEVHAARWEHHCRATPIVDERWRRWSFPRRS